MVKSMHRKRLTMRETVLIQRIEVRYTLVHGSQSRGYRATRSAFIARGLPVGNDTVHAQILDHLPVVS
jgi:hypothetical protein